MKRSLIPFVWPLLLAACGGGAGTPADPSTSGPPAEATAVGQPMGVAAQASIGPAGGTLASADGAFSVEVPPGAFDRVQTLTLQEISNEAHGAPGRAWRLEPANLVPAQPLTLRFAYGDADLQGTADSELRAAYQDAQKRWVLPAEPTVDSAARRVSVRATRMGDWSRFARTWLVPGTATVAVGSSVTLKVVRCEITGFNTGDGRSSQLLRSCQPAPETKTMGPQVNGASGCNCTVGSVARQNADRAEYVYTAPAQVPNPRTVAVSVQTLLSGPAGSTAQSLLVSNITIEDGRTPCSWLHDTPALSYRVNVSQFEVDAQREGASYHGHGYLSVTGRLVRVGPPAPGLGLVVFTSQGQPAGGLVKVGGTLTVSDPGNSYVETYDGSGAPSSGDQPFSPALFVVAFDTRSCTYSLGGGATVLARVSGGPVSSDAAPLTPGALHFKDLPIEPAAGARTITYQNLHAPYALDTDGIDGFEPWPGLQSMPFLTGSAAVRWELKPAK